jgi:hypothetical protein
VYINYEGKWELGWALEIESFLGLVKWHRVDRRVKFGAQKLEISMAQPPPTCPSNGYARIQNIMHRATGLYTLLEIKRNL